MFCISDFPALSDSMSAKNSDAFQRIAHESFSPFTCRRSMRVKG
jgi:hypothetical protein